MELTVNEPSILKFNVIERNNKMKQGIIISNVVLINNFIVLSNFITEWILYNDKMIARY